MSEWMTSLFSFILVIAVLVTVHEFGHFWVARRLGIKVLKFSIGFGKPLLRRRGGDTEYVLAAIPLGGYVKMLDEREGPVAKEELARAFNRQTLAVRSAVVLAGPVFNFLLAIAAYALVFMVGVTGLKPIVGEVTPASLAEQGGFQAGDQMQTIAGHPVKTWDEAFLAIMEASLARKDVDVEVLDSAQSERSRHIRFSTLNEDIDRENLITFIGMAPFRLAIPPLIGDIVSGGAAEKAGLLAGDRIIAADGEDIADWRDWVHYVRSRPGMTIDLIVRRDAGETRHLLLVPEPVSSSSGEEIGQIGASVVYPREQLAALQTTVRYGPVQALLSAVDKTWSMTKLTLTMLANMFFGDVSMDNLSGPISIAQFAGQSASLGMTSFLGFIALISISLGVLNLLPIPVLDGGHLFFYACEAVLGRPLSAAAEAMGQRIGMAIILALMLVAFYNDFARILG